MPRRADRRLPLLWALVLAACGPVDADHPLDPATPPEQQRPSRIAGHLVAPGGASFDEARVELWTADADADDRVEGAVAYSSPVDTGGRFRFDAVTPGIYRLAAATGDEALVADPVVLSVPFGQIIDLGAIALEPRWGVVDGRVVDRAGQPVAGATVSGGALRARVEPDGAFSLTLPAGEATLLAEAPGHASARSIVQVSADDVTTLSAPLQLAPLPAQLLGTASLRRFGSPERAAAITLELDDGADVTGPIEGAFGFDGLEPGTHRVVARATGYDAVSRTVHLAAGERRTLDPIVLMHASTGPDAVWLEARIEAADGAAIPGVAAHVRIGTVPFDRAISDRDGRIALPAAADDRYWLDVDTAGYGAASLGPLIYDHDLAAFRGIEGDDPILVLEPRP